MMLVVLAAGEKADKPETWLTIARLNSFLPKLGIAPGRTIVDFITGLQEDGLLTTRRSPLDARVRILQPTEKMLEIDREWLQLFHAPLALLYPDDDYQGAMMRDPAYQRAYRIASLTTLELAERIVGGNPPADYFIRESVGTRVLMALMQEVRGAPDGRTGPGFYTRAATLTGVSRTHVRNVLQGAIERGWIRTSDPPGLYVEVMDELRGSVERWVAESTAGVDIVHGMALAILK
jgi:DNA-binding MarR family transcriptional regulator